MDREEAYRVQLIRLIDGVDARMPFEDTVADFPDEAMNTRPPNVGYTPWHIIEHMRLTQVDMLEYVTNADYTARIWPDDFWPDPQATTDRDGWEASVQGFLADRAALRALVADPSCDILAPIERTPGHTIARGVRIIGDHNAYHVGEFAILRQVMGTWPPGRES